MCAPLLQLRVMGQADLERVLHREGLRMYASIVYAFMTILLLVYSCVFWNNYFFFTILCRSVTTVLVGLRHE